MLRNKLIIKIMAKKSEIFLKRSTRFPKFLIRTENRKIRSLKLPISLQSRKLSTLILPLLILPLLSLQNNLRLIPTTLDLERVSATLINLLIEITDNRVDCIKATNPLINIIAAMKTTTSVDNLT